MGRINDWQEIYIGFFRELVADMAYNTKHRSDGSYMVYYRNSPQDRFPKRVVVNIKGSLSEQIKIEDVLNNLSNSRIAQLVSVYYSIHYDCYEMSFRADSINQYFL
jgi:hypothetical protein